MKLRFALPAAIMMTVCVMASPAYASDDPIEQAIEGLGSSNVYVESGAPGTTDQTTATIQSKLRADDGIVVVVLANSDEPINQIAKKIDDATGNDSIIALAVDDQVVGYSTALPDGVAADLMQRADNVSVSTVQALDTFIRTTHTYETQNPDVFNPPPPPSGATDGGMTVWPFVLIGLLLILALAAAIVVRLRRRTPSELTVRFHSTPDAVREKMDDVLRLRSRVDEPAIVSSLTKTGQYTEAYFRNARKQPDGQYRGTRDILRYLPDLESVVQRYVKVQDEPELHRSPIARLSEYGQAIQAFERFMLEQVRSANADEEFDARKAADILNASELRSIRPSESE